MRTLCDQHRFCVPGMNHMVLLCVTLQPDIDSLVADSEVGHGARFVHGFASTQFHALLS